MEDLPVPLSRVELYLAKAAGMDVTVPEAPESRLEQFLAIIAGDTTVEMPTPLSLTEMWLAYVIGVTPDPLLPVEGACYIGNQKVDVRYFAVAAGMPGAVLPEAPENRKEQYWALIQGGGGGVLKYAIGTNITLTDVVRGIEELQYVYGDTVQNGTPTPDAPVAVQTVTGEQTVNVSDGGTAQSYTIDLTGKNLFDKNNPNTINGYFNPDYSQITATTYPASIYIPCEPNTTYTVQRYENGLVHTVVGYTTEVPQIGTTVYGIKLGTHGVVTATTGNNAKYLVARIYHNNQDTLTFNEILATVQIEKNSQPTPYAPYYNYELCKIGNYQDYIYKSGDDWYVHKEVGKVVLDGTTGGFNSGNDWYYAGVVVLGISPATTQTLSNYFTASNESYMIDHKTVDGLCAVNHSKTHLILRNLDCTSANEYRTWLGNTNPIFYYLLATPTDTKITDATLVGQLEAIDSAVLPKPIAYITVGATDPNLPGPLKISYYGEEE